MQQQKIARIPLPACAFCCEKKILIRYALTRCAQAKISKEKNYTFLLNWKMHVTTSFFPLLIFSSCYFISFIAQWNILLMTNSIPSAQCYSPLAKLITTEWNDESIKTGIDLFIKILMAFTYSDSENRDSFYINTWMICFVCFSGARTC